MDTTRYSHENVQALIDYSPGTMISVDGSPFVRMEDGSDPSGVGFYLDIMSGKAVHASRIIGRKVFRCWGSQICW